jgi:SAM-dependent methyltransferase
MTEAGVLLEKLDRFDSLFAAAPLMLELGGGQGWASCIVKRYYPDATVIASDIAPAAVASAHRWQRIFRVHLGGVAAHTSSDLPYRDSSIDLIFAFASAHHFGRHRRTLLEIARVLRPGATAVYLHEPACRAWIHRIAHRRVNRKRPAVPEDVIMYRRLADLATGAGLRTEFVFEPSLLGRGAKETVYYLALRAMPFLSRVLPTSVDAVFTKPAGPA